MNLEQAENTRRQRDPRSQRDHLGHDRWKGNLLLPKDISGRIVFKVMFFVICKDKFRDRFDLGHNYITRNFIYGIFIHIY